MSMTARPVIAARSCRVNALPSRLANRSSSLVSCGSHDRRRINVLWRLVGVVVDGDVDDTGLDPQQVVVVEGAEQLGREQRVAGGGPKPLP